MGGMSHVLYIDDEPDILELAEIYFAEKGIKIHTAKDANAALKAYSENNFSVIISDARMPGLKGTELFHQLKTQHGFTGHFILVSGHYESHETDALPAGITLVLTKPIDFDELIGTVSKLL